MIRVTDMGFDEAVLLDQDKFLAAMLTRPEFQKKMTGTELRYKLGAHYTAQEKATGGAAGSAIHLRASWYSGLCGRTL